jgi:cytochrome c peroxidase
MQKILSFMLIVLFSFLSPSVQAADDVADQFARQFNVARTLVNLYAQEAKNRNPNSKLTSEAGRAFYIKKVSVDGKDVSCSSCHSDDPTKDGKHNETGKPIKPLAISANPDRFSDQKKVEKNFLKHCRDLYGHECSAQDKGDYLTYLLSVEKKK